MLPLCTLLLQRGVATLAEIEAALARQAQFGDDLVTNLLDVASVDEAKLVEVIADCYGMRASVPGRLPQPDAKTLKTVPAAIATRVPLLPLRISRDCLVVVVAAKVSPGVEHDVSFSLGLRLDQEISSRSRVLQGIERAYSIPLRRRHARIAARLDGQDDPSPSVTRPAPAQLLFAPQLPHGPAARLLSNSAPPNVPGIAPNVASNIAPSIAPTLPPPPPASPSFQSSSPRQSVPPKPRSGPFELQNARKALESASGNAEVIAVFFDFAKQFFEYTALFVVRDDLAEGLTAAGPGVSRDRIRGIGVPLDLPSVLSRARDQKRHVLDVPSDDGTDAALRQDLQRPMRARVLTVALAVRGRVVALLYGDDGAVDVELNMVSDVLALVPNVGTAMEGLILRRKRQGGGTVGGAVGGSSAKVAAVVSPGVSGPVASSSVGGKSDGSRGEVDKSAKRSTMELPAVPAALVSALDPRKPGLRRSVTSPFFHAVRVEPDSPQS